MSGYRKGVQYEQLVVDLYRAEGWWAQRSAGSHGSADVVALKHGERPRLIQVKFGVNPSLWSPFSPAERRRLRLDAMRAGADAFYVRWYPGVAQATVVPVKDWPRDDFKTCAEYEVDDESGCWLWARATTRDGYGSCAAGLAHRVVWQRTRGPIPKGLVLDHLCAVRRCVNPDHLEPVTRCENNRRGGLTRLTRGQALTIKRANGRYADIGAEFGVTKSLVCAIKAGRLWRDLPPVEVGKQPGKTRAKIGPA